jgi:hypothetical protein
MSPHRLRRAALHLPTRRSERGLLYFYHGLLGTYIGWNPISSGPLKGRERQLAGGYIPFARTKAERLAKGDPRLSIEERYSNLWQYLSQAAKQALEMAKQRLLLPEDATRLLQQLITDMKASQLLLE